MWYFNIAWVSFMTLVFYLKVFKGFTESSVTMTASRYRRDVKWNVEFYICENLSRSACSSPRIPVFFLFRYMGGRQTCLRCVFRTRHEYGADSSSEAAANDGTELRTAAASGAVACDSASGRSGEPAREISTDIFSCLESPSACFKFAMLFSKTGRHRFPSSV